MLPALGMIFKDDVVRKKGLYVTLTIMFFSLTVVALSQTYYLDASKGKDSNSGSSSSPWKTVAKAQSAVQPGDKVLLANGDYDSFTPPNVIYGDDALASLEDTEVDWISWEAKPGHTPTFKSVYFEKEGNKYFLGYWLKGLSFNQLTTKNMVALNIENCEVVGHGNDISNAYGGLEICDSSNIKVTDSKIHFIKETGVTISSSAYITISGCDVYDIGTDHFTMRTEYRDCDNIRITGNTIRDTLWWNPSAHPDGIQYYASNGNAFRNCVFAGNKMYNLAVQGIFISGGRFIDGVIENNLVYDCGSGAVNIDDTTDTIFRNNTMLGYCVFASRNSNLAIYNNIIYGTYVLQDLFALGYHDYNIYSQAYSDWVGGSEPHSYTYSQSQLFTMLSQLFTNSGKNDYSLRNCVAVDFCPRSPSGASDDITGKIRSNYPDAGCYEYNGSAPSGNDDKLSGQDTLDPKVQRKIDRYNLLIEKMEARYNTMVDKLNDKIDSIADSSIPDERKTKLIERMELKIQRLENSFNAKIEKLEDKLSDLTS
jgi:hypothetical protein